MPYPTQTEFSKLTKSKKTKIKIYQTPGGYWRVNWYGGGSYYVSLGTGKGYSAWLKALEIAVGSQNKDPFIYAVLSGHAMRLETKKG